MFRISRFRLDRFATCFISYKACLPATKLHAFQQQKEAQQMSAVTISRRSVLKIKVHGNCTQTVGLQPHNGEPEKETGKRGTPHDAHNFAKGS